jgi:hypothetical protein
VFFVVCPSVGGFSLALENFIIIIGVILRNFNGIVCEVKWVMLQGVIALL